MRSLSLSRSVTTAYRTNSTSPLQRSRKRLTKRAILSNQMTRCSLSFANSSTSLMASSEYTPCRTSPIPITSISGQASRLVAVRQSLHFCRRWRRKPNLGFYRHVLDDIAADPRSVVFVDDKPENVLSARSFGMRGIVFDDQKRVIQAIRNAVEDPVQRARSYLQRNAKLLHSVTSNGLPSRKTLPSC
jgi:hypothetical protein